MHVNVNDRELKELTQWLAQSPKQFSYAAAQFLNDVAFEARTSVQDYLKATMTIRGKFVLNKVRVWKARGSSSLKTMYSSVGMIEYDRFSGLVEQEYGTPTRRRRHGTIAGRSGSRRNRIKGGYRMKPGKPFLNPRAFPKRSSWMAKFGGGHGSAADAAVFGMLRTLDRMKYPAPFIIQGHSKIPDGLYRFARTKNKYGHRELTLLQAFKRKQPLKTRWMANAVGRYLRSARFEKLWAEAIYKEIVFRNKSNLKWR